MSDTIARLSENRFGPDIRDYLRIKAEKKAAEAAARIADQKLKILRTVIFAAMEGAPIARCGNAVITLKPGRVNPGALTLKDKRKIALNDIREIVLDNGLDVIEVDEVETWFGGSRVSDDIEITLTGENT